MRAHRRIRSLPQGARKALEQPLQRKRRCVGRFNLRPERSKRPRDGIVLHAGQHNAPARTDKAAQSNIQTVRRVHGENDLLRRGVEQLRRLGAAGIDDPRRRVCRRMAAAPDAGAGAHRALHGRIDGLRLLQGRCGAVKIDHGSASCHAPSAPRRYSRRNAMRSAVSSCRMASGSAGARTQ